MNKKGFTLAELMGVIIILGIILLLTLPAVDKTIKNAKATAYDAQVDKIIAAANDWALLNARLLPKNDNESITIYLGELKSKGLIDINVKNPKTNKIISNNSSVVITKKADKNIYTVNIIDVDKKEDSNAPILIISGSIVDYVEVNQDDNIYVIPSAIAKTATGEEIDDSYISYQIVKNDQVVSVVDTSKIGTYKIIYTVTYQEKTGIYEKIVEVRDTLSPSISIIGNLEVMDSEDINYMEGVSVSDNSGEEITPSIEIENGTDDKNYTVYYTAKDSSGNVATKKRQVIINQ